MPTIFYVKGKEKNGIVQGDTYCDYCGKGFTLPIDAEIHEVKCGREWRVVNEMFRGV